LLGDLTRRVTATEAAWEQQRLEAREDARYEIEDQFRTNEIAAQDAAAKAEAAQAATTVGQLKSMGFQDEIIGLALQANGAAKQGEGDYGTALSSYLDTFQENTIGGPNPMSQFQRFQVESAAKAIQSMEQQANAMREEGWRNYDASVDPLQIGQYGPGVGPSPNAQMVYENGKWVLAS